MKRSKRALVLHAVAALAIAALAFGLRWRAIERLPEGYDEGTYLEAAERIARPLRAGDLGALTASNFNTEHPQLAKLVFALSLLPAERSAPSPARGSVWGGTSRLPEAQLMAARTAAGVLGALEALLLAWIHPLAGLLLAIHTYTVKYTSLVMLEPLPALTSLASVACYVRSRAGGSGWWLASSSILLGLTVAAKYMYAVVGFAMLIDWALALRRAEGSLASRLRPLLLWGGGSLVVFVAAYPRLWPDPLGRLRDSLFYHAGYSTSVHVIAEGFPFWQPLAWLTLFVPNDVPEVRPYLFRLDPLVTVLAVIGLDRVFRKQRVYALWLGLAVIFLLLWNTKWDHYVLILTAPLCLAAAAGLERLAALPRALWSRRRRAAARATGTAQPVRAASPHARSSSSVVTSVATLRSVCSNTCSTYSRGVPATASTGITT
jgi:hypothetical protein